MSDEYDSSSDDEDYVPTKGRKGDEESDDDNDNYISADENEVDLNDTVSGKRRGNNSIDSDGGLSKKQKSVHSSTTLANNETVDSSEADQAAARQKASKIDALWAELNSPATKPSRPTSRLSNVDLSSLGSVARDGNKETGGRYITITTTYEFAGETVTSTKDVPENSQEAKDFLARQQAVKEGRTSTPPQQEQSSLSSSAASSPASSTNTPGSSLPTTPRPSSISNPPPTSGPSSASTATSFSSSSSSLPRSGPTVTTRPSVLDSLANKKKGPPRHVRPKSNLDALAATYGVKKPAKLNTLEKSKLDWNSFVGKEGIEDELKHHNKDGYMEKVAFLQRTDDRRDQEYKALKKGQGRP